MVKYIKSPLNYTGNKYRILDQIIPKFPTDMKVMVDMFCGGATVGLNAKCDKVIFIDNDLKVINLLKHLARQSFEDTLQSLEKLINKYNLSYSFKKSYSFYSKQINDVNKNNGLKGYNMSGFYELRRDYNNLKDKTNLKANNMLYLLMVYGFNNDLRFNSKGEFNLPVGKTDLNKSNISKLKNYYDKINKMDIEFICGDFRDKKIKEIVNEADFIYMDPPYLITEATYNKTSGWNEETERELLSFIDDLIKNKKRFMLSNVIEKFGRINEPLNTWTKLNKNNIIIDSINYHYRSSSYNKINRQSNEKEIIVYLEKQRCHNG